MTIGKITGPSLTSDLNRQGENLQFSTNSQPLLYLDFASFLVGINTNTSTATETLTINGNLKLGNIKIDANTITSDNDLVLSYSNDLLLGDIANVKITGGTPNYLMTTDGAGNLSWQNLNAVSTELMLTANNIIFGTPLDQSLVDHSAYRRWTANTTITDATDNLNQVMLNVYQNTYVGNAAFTSNTTSGPSPLTVQFNSTVFGNPDSYIWRFGDGSTSTDPHPLHTYDNVVGGNYSVYFKAYNSAGTIMGAGELGEIQVGSSQGSYYDTEATNYITLYTPAPVPSFSVNFTSINDGAIIELTNTSQHAESYVIDWGDGTSTVVSSNVDVGGVNGAPVAHMYTNDTSIGDSKYPITLRAFSSTAGSAGLEVTSQVTNIFVYSEYVSTITPDITLGNNQHAVLPNGLTVAFTTKTQISGQAAFTPVGPTATFLSNKLKIDWGDGTVTDNIIIGDGSPGNMDVPITHVYTLVDPLVEQTFEAILWIYNGNSASPIRSSTVTPALVTVKPAPTALFEANSIVISDRTGDTPQTGYLFTDLSGVDRAEFTFYNTSLNAVDYTWTYGDGSTLGPIAEGAIGTPTGGAVTHTYTQTGNKTVSLLSHGVNSLLSTDDTKVITDYITILPTPPEPDALSTKTISTTSSGNSPLLAALATNNSLLAMPLPGTSVTRITTGNVITNTMSDVYDAFSGTLTPVFNGVDEFGVVMSSLDNTGTHGSLVITEDKDAHLVDATVYPSNFYKVFSGYLTKTNDSLLTGYNTLSLVHTTTGSTNVLGLVKDPLTSVPVIDVSADVVSTEVPGVLRYVSGVPYFTTGGKVAVDGVLVYNWIGQCYLDTTTPVEISAGVPLDGSGTIISAQNLTYADLDGTITYLSGGIPIANTGLNAGSKYALGKLVVDIDGTASATSRLKMVLSNVNGNSSTVELSKMINVYSTPLLGINESSIPVSPILGSGYTSDGKRIAMNLLGATPAYNNAFNYYVNSVFDDATVVEGTDEAIVRFGIIQNDITDYSSYLPVGPNLSTRTGTQYFRIAFTRQTVANFTVTYSGKISGMWIAAPGTQIDSTSTLNGWLDATIVYAGVGIPGANAIAGGNGSNGCAKTSGDIVQTGQLVSNRSCVLTLGSENASNATNNQIFITIAVAAGDSVTSINVN